MNKKGNLLHKILLGTIGVLAVLLAALLVPKIYNIYTDRVQEKEWKVRNTQVQSELMSVQTQIQELSGDSRALQEFLDQNIYQTQSDAGAGEAAEVISQDVEVQGVPGESQEEAGQDSAPELSDVSENALRQDGTFAGDAVVVPEPAPVSSPAPEEVVSNNAVPAPAPEEIISNNTVPEPVPEEIISNNTVPEPVPEEIISNNTVPEDIPESTISGNAVVDGKDIPFRYQETGMSLEERRSIKTSYQETQETNAADMETIANSNIDFSNMTIACLGDSMTAGSNMDSLENYMQYSYPSVLKEILNFKEVYNLGIGGSSYGRYWDNAFVDRYTQIPADTDIILVMGGANDGFSASEKEIGTFSERKKKTFYGDVDELMRGLRENYPNAIIIFATPLPNVLHDYLMKQRDYLLPQQRFCDAIEQLAIEYGIHVIDLYNSNILDTHDSQVISAFMPDGVHCNPEGYRVMAEHFAGELTRIMEFRQENGIFSGSGVETISGNTSVPETISGNTNVPEIISGNSLPVQEPVSPEPAQSIEPYTYDGEAIVIE